MIRYQAFVACCGLLGLLTGCTPTPGETAQKATRNAGVSREISWVPAPVSPCMLLLTREAETILGPLQQKPALGATAIDGTACVYVARAAVLSVGVLSTMAFESRKCQPWNVAITEIGVDAYAVSLSPGDIQVFARTSQAAVMMTLTTERTVSDTITKRMVTDLAVIALRRLAS